VRAPLQFLDGGVLLRLAGRATVAEPVERLERAPLLLLNGGVGGGGGGGDGERVTKSKRDEPSREPKSKLVASGATRELIESMRDRRRACRGACSPHGARHRGVGEEKHIDIDDELRVPDGRVEGPARHRAASAGVVWDYPIRMSMIMRPRAGIWPVRAVASSASAASAGERLGSCMSMIMRPRAGI